MTAGIQSKAIMLSLAHRNANSHCQLCSPTELCMHVTINIHLLMHFVYIVITDIRRSGFNTYIYILIHVGQNMPNMLFLLFQIRRSFVTH